MPWTASLEAHSIANGRNRLTVRYSDGAGNEVLEVVTASPRQPIGDLVRDRLEELELVSAYDAALKVGALTPTGPDLKTELSIARNAYEEQSRLVELGLADAATLPALKQAYADALAALN